MVKRPTSLRQALLFLQEENTAPVAGCTDFMLGSRAREPVFLDRIVELSQVAHDGSGLSIGSGCTFTALQSMEIPSALRDAARQIASPAIRNIATIGGNICNASPAGDTLPVLYALDASVELKSLQGTRIMPIQAFITGRKKTAIEKGELLTRVVIPDFTGIQWFRKVSARRAQALSKCTIAACLQVEEGTIRDFRVAFGAVGLTVVRSIETETLLRNQSIAEAKRIVPELLSAYSTLLSPIDDARSTAEYRRRVCVALLGDFLARNL